MSGSILETLPPLRATVEITPIEAQGDQLFCLRDRLDPSATPIVVSATALLLISLVDGRRNLGDLRAAFLLRAGRQLADAEVRSFLERVDEAGLLDSPRARERLARQRQQFEAAAERPAMHAGSAYPAAAEELRPFLDRLYTSADGPGQRPASAVSGCLRGLIAPHIDLHRGGATYAWTYKALAERQPADLYLILGTCHTPMRAPIAATRKAYATPLGPAPTAQAFLDLLEREYPGDLYEDEFSHRGEHSIEFQALYLRYLGHVGGSARSAVVPLLCGALPGLGGAERGQGVSQGVVDALAALRRALAEFQGRVCLIAGADLAHVGPQFGDRAPVSRTTLEQVARADLEMLEIICRGDADGFYSQVMADDDARRICGLSPIYFSLALLGPSRGQLLKYSQWIDRNGQGSVTYAGVMFDE